ELHEMGERAHQLFKDKYTREINTMKYYNLLK
ncbi:glycosyltransferase WbuB, partial [Escherichia coli]|nr:glycosyltransferase WbuB [Escherichia coli]